MNEAPLLDDEDAVGHGQRLLLVMGDHYRGDAQPLLQLADFAAQQQAYFGIEGGERLVEEQQAGRHRQGAGQSHPLLLPAGELGGVLAPHAAHADQVEELIDPRVDLLSARPPALQTVGDVVAGREVGKKGVGLEDDADVAL